MKASWSPTRKTDMGNTDGRMVVFIRETIQTGREMGKERWSIKMGSNMKEIGRKVRSMGLVYIVLGHSNLQANGNRDNLKGKSTEKCLLYQFLSVS